MQNAANFPKFRKKGIDKRAALCYTLCIEEIEAHCTISIAQTKPPRLCEKGVGAEADAVACILAGSSENIRSAVAEKNCEGLSEA